MQTLTTRAVAALLAAPLLVLGVGTAASASPDPDDAGRFSDRRTHTGPDGATSVETTGCTDSEGNVHWERRTRRADANGEDARTRRSGDPAACARGTERAGSSRDGAPALANVNAPIDIDGVGVLGGDGITVR